MIMPKQRTLPSQGQGRRTVDIMVKIISAIQRTTSPVILAKTALGDELIMTGYSMSLNEKDVCATGAAGLPGMIIGWSQ